MFVTFLGLAFQQPASVVNSWIMNKDAGSWIQYRGQRLLDPGFRIRILDQISTFLCQFVLSWWHPTVSGWSYTWSLQFPDSILSVTFRSASSVQAFAFAGSLKHWNPLSIKSMGTYYINCIDYHVGEGVHWRDLSNTTTNHLVHQG